MQAPVKRKIVTSGDPTHLRSTTNTPSALSSGTIKPKVNAANVVHGRARTIQRGQSPARSDVSLRPDEPLKSVRSPSPIRLPAKSSPVSRVTSPDPVKGPKSFSASASTLNVVIPRTKATPVALSKRASASVVASPGSSPASSLRVMASVRSLPPSPAQAASTASPMASLQPGPSRSHLRHNSVGDASSLGTHSPSSSSIGTFDGNQENTTTRVGSVMGGFTSQSNPNGATSPPIRVKSKVSSLALSAVNGSASPSSSRAPSLRPITRKSSISSASGRGTSTPRQRSPSISSTVSSPPAPINRPTASRANVKALNIHSSHYQPFTVPSLPAPPAPESIEGMLSRSPPKIFPKSPPHSATSLTFPRARGGTGSSSYHPDRYDGASEVGTPREVNGFKHLEGRGSQRNSLDAAEQDAQAEARSNRKIEDLEITNRSLMAINTMLEATKARQAKEIRELRRKLRETRLTLPPKEYAALRSSKSDSAESEGADPSATSSGGDTDEEGELEHDPAFDRVRIMIENMIGYAAEAVKRVNEPLDVDEKSAAVKVLTAAEVKRYNNQRSQDDGEMTEDDHDDHNDMYDDHTGPLPTESDAGTEFTADTDHRDFSSLEDRGFSVSRSPSPLPPRLTITSDSPAASSSSFSPSIPDF
ncbi:hypothetical protein FRB99_008864 [Tulasnella sp. 403]|nr:hypothetical protein FRB99_008864 [Tulasnella sp. 403]